MTTKRSETVANLLLVAQFSLIGILGLLVLFAPATLIFRIVWWAHALLGTTNVLVSVANFARTRQRPAIWIGCMALLGLALMFPTERWMLEAR